VPAGVKSLRQSSLPALAVVAAKKSWEPIMRKLEGVDEALPGLISKSM
jgi:hypothetical protein